MCKFWACDSLSDIANTWRVPVRNKEATLQLMAVYVNWLYVLFVLGLWVAVRSEERAVSPVDVPVFEAFLLTAIFGTPSGSG